MLKKIIADEFDCVFEIMEHSFPPDEYRPYGEQKALLDNDIYKILAVSDENDGVMGFAAVYELENVTFAEHLAVDERYRNLGIGAKILQELKAKGRRIVLEVEPPDGDIAKRRIGFYKRNGFFLNGYPYLQPPISQGKKPVPLMLMTTDGKIGEQEFEALKTEIYKKVYGVIA